MAYSICFKDYQDTEKCQSGSRQNYKFRKNEPFTELFSENVKQTRYRDTRLLIGLTFFIGRKNNVLKEEKKCY